MKTVDLLTTAFRNAFRSKLRTSLTVLAIVIGAFTLALTNGIGAGVNDYIDDTVAIIGVDDVMNVSRTTETTGLDGGPAEYDPNELDASTAAAAQTGVTGHGAGKLIALTDDDIDAIANIDGVLRVEPVTNVSVDYVQYEDGPKYQVRLSQIVPGMRVELAAGDQVDLDASEPQIVLSDSYLEPLGIGTAEEAVGRDVALAVTDATGTQTTVRATVVGISVPGLVSMEFGAIPNTSLIDALFEQQTVGRPQHQAETFAAATVWFDPDAGSESTAALKELLADAGYTATTLEDQLGAITSVIDTIVLVLNGFAIIALLAASIGIVNTLFMAVQERTREVGLMKAMGLSSARVFSLFSVEAVVIGLLGSAIGVLAAIGVGELTSVALSGSILSDLPGLTLVVFEPAAIAAVILGVMAVAFVAGTLPALRAAKADPISSLRYE